MQKVLKDKELQNQKAADARKEFEAKPVIGDLKPTGVMRKK